MHVGKLAFVFVVVLVTGAVADGQGGRAQDEVAWSIKHDPRTLDPAKVEDQVSEMVRFLTGGVLLRLNRQTQRMEPALAESWSVSSDGRLVTFRLRGGLRFSDGSPLGSQDVVATLKRVLDPATAAPAAEEFLSPREVLVEAVDALTVKVHLPKRVVAIGKVFDEIAVEPRGVSSEGRVTAGSFVLAEYSRGQYLRLRRNPYYWKHDASGGTLPYLASLRLDVLSNREQDQTRFVQGRYQVMDSLPAENYAVLEKTGGLGLHDLGPSLNTEQMWFNQAVGAPLPTWERAWFQSRGFRTAVSQAIHRADLVRIAYAGHATVANGFISPANTAWYDRQLPAVPQSTDGALRLLAKEGFRQAGGKMVDRDGHVVKFSLLTNAGNRSREKMASLIQQDLAALGMQVNVVTLDFPALLERLTHSLDYEAALLGSIIDPDPSEVMNVWLSSSPSHAWNPSQPKPVTDWEAEVDRQMQAQAVSADVAMRKHAVDRVQEIAFEQQPFIYLVYPNALCAVSPMLEGVDLSVLPPVAVSNIDHMRWKGAKR